MITVQIKKLEHGSLIMQEMNDFVCNICGSTEHHEFGVRSDQREVVACSACGMGVLKSIPEDTSIFYVGDYYAAESENDGYSDYDFTASHSLLWVKYAIEYFCIKGNILDIGAANGFLLSQLSNSYLKYGIEVNNEACLEAEGNGVRIISSDIYDVDSKYESYFDIITSIATYEHVIDFRRAVENSLQLLKPDGVLIFEVPVISDKQDSSIWYRTSLEHIYYPTVSGLTELFRILGVSMTGFESSVEGFGTTYIGIVTRNPNKALLASKFISTINEKDIAKLSEEDRIINVSFNIVHSFFPTSEGILALPLLIRRGINNNVMSRLTQLWHSDFIEAYRLRVENEQKKMAFDELTKTRDQQDILIKDLKNSVRNIESAKKYARRVNDSIRDFSKRLEANVDLNDPELKEIFDLSSISPQNYSHDNFESADRIVEINQKMLFLLTKYRESADRTHELIDRLNSVELRLSEVMNSTSWRATEGLRRTLSHHPRIADIGRRSMKILSWTLKGTLFQHLKLYMAHHRKEKAMAAVGSRPVVHYDKAASVMETSVNESKGLQLPVQFTPTLSIVLCLKSVDQHKAVSDLLDAAPGEWELMIVGMYDEWRLSHPLLRYLPLNTSQNFDVRFEEIINKTFGKCVVLVGEAETDEVSNMVRTDTARNVDIQQEVAKLTLLLGQIEEGGKMMRIQRLWRRCRNEC